MSRASSRSGRPSFSASLPLEVGAADRVPRFFTCATMYLDFSRLCRAVSRVACLPGNDEETAGKPTSPVHCHGPYQLPCPLTCADKSIFTLHVVSNCAQMMQNG
jgi:hypothetical protein